MTVNLDLSFFKNVQLGPLYVIGDDVFLAHPRSPRRPLHRVGTLSAWLKAVGKQIPRNDAVARAWQHIERMEELRFCVCQLAPYLKFIDTRKEADIRPSADLEWAITDLSRRAADLRQAFAIAAGLPVPLALLEKTFGAPCVVTPEQVIPLERVSPIGVEPCHITINGVGYRRCVDRARSFVSVISSLEVAIRNGPGHDGVISDADEHAARVFLQGIERVTGEFQPMDTGPYRVIRSGYHQLQYSRGHFVLIRGPITVPTSAQRGHQFGRIYVGLYIKGKSRHEMLSMPPRRAETEGGFWTSAGVLNNAQPICMGKSEQFRKLRLPEFTDAEAILQWLHAAARIASGAAAICRQRRSVASGQPSNRRLFVRR